MGARELLASLAVATGQQVRLPVDPQPRDKRGPIAGDPVVRFFDTRDVDDDVTEFPYGIPQLLRMRNTALTNSGAEIARRLASKHSGDRGKIIEELYLIALSRRPSSLEREKMLAYVDRQRLPAQAYAGIMWALLNCAEFMSNH
jgi:hypothetical protein